MKLIVQNYRSGELNIQEIPPPRLRPNGVLVRTAYSLISAGTERGMVDLAQKNLLEKARSRPDLVKKVIDKARKEGILTAYQKAMQRLDTAMPLGYSSAGLIVEVGKEVSGLEVGAPVACAGLGFASHAEVVSVPRNLCVPVPGGLGLDQAAYVTLGAIALEGVRVADVKLGESVVVIGLGLVGLLVVQVLKAAGCRVFGVDMDPDKVTLALELGVNAAAVRQADNLPQQVAAFTGGHGADAVLVTAATASSDPLELAGDLARDCACVTVVGITGMEVPRKVFYEKALQLRMSRSYGPGRYDRVYEEKGVDYPIGYVRWTENRNMEAFLQLLADKKVNVDRLTTHRFEIDQALEGYDLMLGKRQEPYIGMLLTYGSGGKLPGRIQVRPGSEKPSVSGGAARISVVGAGAFATGVLLPALAKTGARLRGIASQSGMTARSTAERVGFDFCVSDPEELFGDPETDAVAILTRPDSHADLVVRALQQGKHVFVEKPLATNWEQLQQIASTYYSLEESPALMVGFNRRYAPYGVKLSQFFANHADPLVLTYRVNAGELEQDDWQLDPEQGGGRLIGECGHFFDLLSFVCGERPVRVSAAAAGDEDVAVTLQFERGSVGTLTYATGGSPAFSKERLEVFGEGNVGVLDDFRSLDLVQGGREKRLKARLKQEKGHLEEIKAFLRAVREGKAPADWFESAALATLCTFQAVESLRSGTTQVVDLALLAESKGSI